MKIKVEKREREGGGGAQITHLDLDQEIISGTTAGSVISSSPVFFGQVVGAINTTSAPILTKIAAYTVD